MKVSAVIVTRGDVDLSEILESLPNEWERIVWDNGFHGYPHADVYKDGDDWRPDGPPGKVTDLSVYGRYAAIEYAKGDLIYAQDDDCIVSDPQAIVDTWLESGKYPFDGRDSPWGADPRDYVDHVVCNMPANFRHAFYQEHALVGFGAVFHRDVPARAFGHFDSHYPPMTNQTAFFYRTCDIVFTALTPRVLVDVDYQDMPWATAENRMWKQSYHREERAKMLELVLKVRDG